MLWLCDCCVCVTVPLMSWMLYFESIKKLPLGVGEEGHAPQWVQVPYI